MTTYTQPCTLSNCTACCHVIVQRLQAVISAYHFYSHTGCWLQGQGMVAEALHQGILPVQELAAALDNHLEECPVRYEEHVRAQEVCTKYVHNLYWSHDSAGMVC